MSLLPSFNVTLCRVLRNNVQVVRLFRTSVRRSSEKTPIQEFGWDYLMRQRALKRPIAPHLKVYKPQLTWMVSGAHRITGMAMACTLLIGGVGFSLLKSSVGFDFTAFVEYIRAWHLPWVVTDTLKFIIAFPIAFHTLNGIRFLGFDMAKGTDIVSVYRSGKLVLALAALIALAVVAYPRCCEKKAVAAS